MTQKIRTNCLRLVVVFLVLHCHLVTCAFRAPSSTLTSSSKDQSCHKCTCIPGIPGTHGIPGTPGYAGAPGKDGLNGAKGDSGVRGPVGLQGYKGDKGLPGVTGFPGKPGKPGLPGKTGPRGKPGFRGPAGPAGARGLTGFSGPAGFKGKKGEPGSGSYLFNNWHNCVWSRNDRILPRKIGTLVQGCNFTKEHKSTALKVSFHGNLGGTGCKRWYFKFNDKECSEPIPIEALVYTIYLKTNHYFIQGFCRNLPAGSINVSLWVQDCPGVSGSSKGFAYCGHNSYSTIMIEENM